MAIVGGGPVGLGLAVELGQRGVSAVVVEKTTAIHRIPKGQNLSQRTMEHLRVWGVEEPTRAARVMPAGYPAAGVNAYGNLLSEFAHPWHRRADVDQYYFTTNERLPQYLTEQVLRDRVSQLTTVSTMYGTPVQEVGRHDAGALVVTADGRIEADYVVGCDGSHSLVRDQAGIGETRSDHDRRMVLLVFRSGELKQILENRHGKAAFFNVLHPDLDGYWRFVGTVDAAESWFFHAPVPADATADTLDYAALLNATVGTDVALQLDYIGFWDLRIAIADTYRRGRVFLAGDAAHSHPPYGGFGINTGFEDARNLGWKLAAVLQGWGGDMLLDTYTAERRAVFASTAHDFIEAFIENDRTFIEQHNPAEDAAGFAEAWEARKSGSNRAVNVYEPHYEGSPLVFGPAGASSSAMGSHSFTARPGHHLAPRPLASGDDLFDSLGDGFALLVANDGEGAVGSFSSGAASLGIPLRVIRDESIGGSAGYGSATLLVRPDHYVSWVDDGAPYDAATVLGLAIGR